MAPPPPAADHWHISSIEVKAFKSFGPAWSTFDVPSSRLAGIVGPNGCGKSNLLEAIYFAAGGSTSVLRLTGRSLQDVTSTDAGSQRPEVRLHITQGRTTHVLEACLAADGGRSYKIDGRNKTGVQVKDFLKARGIVVDSTTVIQQAAVTGLSESNNAQALAQLVAGASGLSSWNLETAAARQEVARTHQALKNIQSNIQQVQSSVAAEDAAFKAAAEAAALEAQLEQQLQELLRGMQRRKQQLEQQLVDRQQEEQQLQGAEAAAADQLQQLMSERRALATQQAQVSADLQPQHHHSSSASNSSVNSGLVERIAAAEAQADSIKAAIAARAAWAAEVEQQQAALQQQEAECQLLQQRLSDRQQEAATLAANLAAVRTSTDAAAALQQQAQEAARLAAAAAAGVQQQQELVAGRRLEVQQADARLLFVQQQPLVAAGAVPTQAVTPMLAAAPAQSLTPARTAAEADCAVASAAAAAAAASGAAEQHLKQLQGLQQQHMRLQMQVQAAEHTMTPAATASLLAQLGSSRSRTLPLHACFRLKDAAAVGLDSQHLEQLLTPLSVIAGPAVLQTLVAPTVAAANQLLAAAAAASGPAAGGGNSKRLKIWPLDNLTVQDTQRQQRAAQQQLGRQAVMLPLDLLEFDAAARPALLRAFGGMVIAADDATAAALVERFGLSAVTLQGTVSRKGSMTGGWTGSSGSYARTLLGHKLKHDQAAHQLSACAQQLAGAEAAAQQLQQRRSAADAQLAAAQQQQAALSRSQEAREEAAAVAAALQREEQQLAELQERCADLQARQQQYEAALGGDASAAGRRKGAKSAAAGARSGAALLQQQMQKEASKAAAAVTAAEQQLEAAQDKAEELSASSEALQVRVSAAQEPQQQQEALQRCLQTLQQLQQQQDAEEAAARELQQRLQQLQQQQGRLEQQVKAAEQQQKAAQAEALQAAAAAKGAAAALKKLQQDHRQLLREFGGTDAVQACSSGLDPAPAARAATSAAGAEAAAEAPTDAQLQQLSRRARQLQTKLAQLDVPELLPGQKEALAARLAQVAGFTQQADAVKAAAAGLEQQVARDADQVYAANDVVFEDIAAGFSQLCSSLLPSLELQLVRTGKLAHEGLQFRFRRLQDGSAAPSAAAAPTTDEDTWYTSLGQLSGGQRTLVSLAMLLAVARTGSACGLLLLDEVDAALDEVNQARASALLRQLSHDRASACQILCVTHNFSFQESCDGFVRVTKSAAGHSVPAEPGVGGSVAAAAAAAAAGAGGVKKGGRRAGAKQGWGFGRAAGKVQSGAKGAGSKGPGGRSAKRVRFADG